MLDNKLLEALACVVEEGGFDKAAHRLNITQSAVSQRVRSLEEQLGRVLVVRSSPPVATKTGRALVRHLRQVRLLEHELGWAVGFRSAGEFTILPVAVNADSLATWFLDAVHGFLEQEKLLLDICVDDENRTHELLKNGEVAGSVGTVGHSVPGGVSEFLGNMDYLPVCAPRFLEQWFGQGFTIEAASQAPAAVFNRKDETQARMLDQVFPDQDVSHPIFYVPSSESFVDVVLRGLAYGMVPRPQARPHLDSGALIEFLPQARVRVPLFWNTWDVQSRTLSGLGRAMKDYFQQ